MESPMPTSLVETMDIPGIRGSTARSCTIPAQYNPMENYYLTKEPHPQSGCHVLYRADCSRLPPHSWFLGRHFDHHESMRQARWFARNIAVCICCEQHSQIHPTANPNP